MYNLCRIFLVSLKDKANAFNVKHKKTLHSALNRKINKKIVWRF